MSSHGRLSVSIGGGGLIMVQGSNMGLRMRLLVREGRGWGGPAQPHVRRRTARARTETQPALLPAPALPWSPAVLWV